MVTSFFGFRKYVHSLKDKNPDAVAVLDGLIKRHALDEAKVKTFMDKDTGNKDAEALLAKLYALPGRLGRACGGCCRCRTPPRAPDIPRESRQ
jgi:hypothetical protein